VAELALSADVREGRGKGPARKLRAVGKVPAVLYGHGIDAVSLSVDARQLVHTLSTDAGANVLIDLQVDGNAHLTLARSIERDPIRGTIIHVDFLKIARDQTIAVDVPVHFEGESHGVKEGGVLEHHLWQLHLECLPGDVPERINVNVSTLGIGDMLRVGDIRPPQGVTFLTSDDEVIVSCVVPQVLVVEEPVAEEALAEGEEAAAAEEGAPAEGAEEPQKGEEG
jgi:large subunit ribosomal protein L25